MAAAPAAPAEDDANKGREEKDEEEEKEDEEDEEETTAFSLAFNANSAFAICSRCRGALRREVARLRKPRQETNLLRAKRGIRLKR